MEKTHIIQHFIPLLFILGIMGCCSTSQKTTDEINESKKQEATILMNKKQNESTMSKTIEETKAYIGMWVTEDGTIRHELLLNNRYDEARGNRESAYQGSYKVSGNHIDYKDDTGFSADGDFKDGILYHGGMIFYKKNE